MQKLFPEIYKNEAPPQQQQSDFNIDNDNNTDNIADTESNNVDVEITIGECYENVVFRKKNLFMLPNGAPRKNFIREATRLLNA